MARERPTVSKAHALEAGLHIGGASSGGPQDELINLLLNFDLTPEQVYQQARQLLRSLSPDYDKPSKVIDALNRAADALPHSVLRSANQLSDAHKAQVEAFRQKLQQRADVIKRYLEDNATKLRGQHLEQRQQQISAQRATKRAQQSAAPRSTAEREFRQAPTTPPLPSGREPSAKYALLLPSGAFVRLPSVDEDFLRRELQQGSLVLHAQHEVPVVPGEAGYVIKKPEGGFLIVYSKDPLSAKGAAQLRDSLGGPVYDLSTGEPVTKLPTQRSPSSAVDPIAYVALPNNTTARIYSENALESAKQRKLTVLTPEEAFKRFHELNQGEHSLLRYLARRKISKIHQPIFGYLYKPGETSHPVYSAREALQVLKPHSASQWLIMRPDWQQAYTREELERLAAEEAKLEQLAIAKAEQAGVRPVEPSPQQPPPQQTGPLRQHVSRVIQQRTQQTSSTPVSPQPSAATAPPTAAAHPIQPAAASTGPEPAQQPAAAIPEPTGGAHVSQEPRQLLQAAAPGAATARVPTYSMPLPTPQELQAMRAAQEQLREVLQNVKAPPPTPASPTVAPAAAELGTTMTATPQAAAELGSIESVSAPVAGSMRVTPKDLLTAASPTAAALGSVEHAIAPAAGGVRVTPKDLLVTGSPAAAAAVTQAVASPSAPVTAAAAVQQAASQAAPTATAASTARTLLQQAAPTAAAGAPTAAPAAAAAGAAAAQAAAQSARTSWFRDLLTKGKKWWPWLIPIGLGVWWGINMLSRSQPDETQTQTDWAQQLAQQQLQELARQQALQHLYEQLLEQHRQYFPPPKY